MELKSRISFLEQSLVQEHRLRESFEASSNVYSYELVKANERINVMKSHLKNISNSFQFLKAGVAGFSTDLSMAIESISYV